MQKDIKVGDIVYFVSDRFNSYGGPEKYVNFGIVEDLYPHCIYVDLLEAVDTRTIDGIPVKDVKTPGEWHKLPKGWSWNTRLFEVKWNDEIDLAAIKVNIRDPKEVLKAIESGLIVRMKNQYHYRFTSEIDKKHGWRIIRDRANEGYYPYSVTLSWKDVYLKPEEAVNVVKEYEAAMKKQSEMSDLEYAISEIDNVLKKYERLYTVSEEQMKNAREFLMSLPNLEQVVVRLIGNSIEWKYERKKKWAAVNF